jgi:hypothetical protein
MIGVDILNGERIGVAVPLALPDEWEGVTSAAANDILRILDAGIPDRDGNEEYYSIRPQDKDRWAGAVIINYDFGLGMEQKTAAQAKQILRKWIDTGLIEEVEYFSVRQRKDRKGIKSTGRAGTVEDLT